MSSSLWPRRLQRARLLSSSISWSLLRFMSIESVILSSHLILCYSPLLPLIFTSIRIFSNELAHCIRWPKYWSSASTSVLPVNIQDQSPLGWTGWISLQSRGLSRVFSIPQFKSINSLALSFLHSPTLTTIHDYWGKYHKFNVKTTQICSYISVG